MDGGGVVRLSKTKSTKADKIRQNIEALLPNVQPRLFQALLSLNMYSKTGSKGIVEDLSRLGHGISYTQTLSVQNMWAQWTDNQLSYIPSNVWKGEMVTHVFDNNDWKNNNVQRTETHHKKLYTGVQKCDTTEDLAKTNLELKYNFDKKNTVLIKASTKIYIVWTLKEQNPSYYLIIHIMSTKTMTDHLSKH